MKVKKILMIVVGLVFALGGFGMAAAGFTSSKAELIDVTTVSADEISNDYDYNLGEVIILDAYANETKSGIIQAYYCAIAFTDANGELCAGSMEVSKTSRLFDEVQAYLNDDSMGLGDLYMDMYVTTTSLSQTSEVGGYFQDYLLDLSVQGLSVEPVWLNFQYQGQTEQEYLDYAKSASTGDGIFGAILLILGVAMIIVAVAVIGKKKPQQPQAAAYPQQGQYPQPPQMPRQNQGPEL